MLDIAGWLTVNWIEAIGFASGIASVWLFARQHVLAWPVGLVTSFSWLILFAQSGLYADSALQVFFIALGIYGWWHWVSGNRSSATDLRVTSTPPRIAVTLTVVAVTSTSALAVFLSTATDSTVPVADAATTVLSLVASYLLAQKHIENWPVWILGVNVPYIALYFYKGLVLTALLQPLFIALSIRGWLNWRRDLRAARGGPGEAR